MQATVKRISIAIFYLVLIVVQKSGYLYAKESIYVSLNPPVVLPDGSEFKTWRLSTPELTMLTSGILVL
ncbi:MAG: hypothetical protein ACYSU3_18035 [Planctomycetota bacterium]|jgi:hypothetical protein